MKAREFDRRFDDGEDVTEYIDLAKTNSNNQDRIQYAEGEPMNQKVTFEWTPELVKASQEICYDRKLGRTRLVMFGGLALFALGTGAYFLQSHKETGALMIAIIGFFLFAGTLRTRLYGRRLIRDYFEFVDNPTVTVTIAEDAITMTCDNSARTIEWRKITDMKERDDFVFLFAGKLIVSMLPRQALRDDQVEFMRSKINA